MKLLLDTHVFLWWITDSKKLSDTARMFIANSANELFWSAASSWEVAIKFAIGRLPLPASPGDYLPAHFASAAVRALPVSDEHAYGVARLPPYHADPFDRILIAQAVHEDLAFLSADRTVRQYDVEVVW